MVMPKKNLPQYGENNARLFHATIAVMNLAQDYQSASIKTADNLKTIANTISIREVSQLTLPEIEQITDLVGRIVPAGNVPAMVLSGLTRLQERRPPAHLMRQHINLLFQGAEQFLDGAVYSAFFAGPAAVIWGYQNLLKLAGKDPEDSFPDGVWQFYVEYALREDTARHANETHGFDSVLQAHRIQLRPVDRLTAWTMAAIYSLHQFHDLLANEWRERVATTLLAEISNSQPGLTAYRNLYRKWQTQLPYRREADAAPTETYPAYRRRKLEQFLAEATQGLPNSIALRWKRALEAAERSELPAYQQQMSIVGYLDPGPHSETRTSLSLNQLSVGVIVNGHYYLIPACQSGQQTSPDINFVRNQIAAILASPDRTPATDLTRLAVCQRAPLAKIKSRLNQNLQKDLETLRYVPILLNFDQRGSTRPLAEIRQAERGIGDHALTIFDTGKTFVFDQSHIYFDGGWGAALAEIMTNEALAWAVYLRTLPSPNPAQPRPHSLTLAFKPSDMELLKQIHQVTPEAAAETKTINLKAILGLRQLFKRRSDLLSLTVNDLLVLYRAIHALIYRSGPALRDTIQKLASKPKNQQAAELALKALQLEGNPAMLIPVDASQGNPRDRLFPMSFEVPLKELDFLNLHRQCLQSLAEYQGLANDRAAAYRQFDQLQREYLASLAGFGQVMNRAKQIAIQGESASVGSIKLLAHMPTPIQRLLDEIPSKFDVLNDIIKGREVFSNLGAVAPSSSLVRFITAKDDNEKKTLAWGILTDATGVMRISLRDFRPHVAALHAIGQKALANQMAQEYLEAYAQGFNHYIQELRQITMSSRETRLEA